ncbi:MAG: hypothetical protein U9Q77_01395 [Candidatus Marinimicrobia bacterium]|nr:hypothetical protein [Candidatus Neomarinimicrobiota bacterium]
MAVTDIAIEVVEDLKADEVLIQALRINSGEDSSRRWLSISGEGLNSGSTLLYPIYETNGNEGSFWIKLTGFETSAYLGNRMLRDHGQYPIHFQVDLIDSQTVAITGKTLPYDDVRCTYSFDLDEYRLEFIFHESTPMQLFDPASPNQPSHDSNLSFASGEGRSIASGTTHRNSTKKVWGMLKDSVMIASSVLGLVLLILGIILTIIKMKQKWPAKSQKFADVLGRKAQNDDHVPEVDNDVPPVNTPEIQEARIRELMQTDNISYDEASLRIQYQTMNLDSD